MVQLNYKEIESSRYVRSFTRREIVSAAGLLTQLNVALWARLRICILLCQRREDTHDRG